MWELGVMNWHDKRRSGIITFYSDHRPYLALACGYDTVHIDTENAAGRAGMHVVGRTCKHCIALLEGEDRHACMFS